MLLLHIGQFWIKLNNDGAVSQNRYYAGIGGVFRDADANWLWGFLMLLGKDEIFKIKARVILEGLRITQERGFR